MRRNRLLIILFLLTCLLLGGCGGESVKDSEAESGNSTTAESDNDFGAEPGNGSGNISAVSAGKRCCP